MSAVDEVSALISINQSMQKLVQEMGHVALQQGLPHQRADLNQPLHDVTTAHFFPEAVLGHGSGRPSAAQQANTQALNRNTSTLRDWARVASDHAADTAGGLFKRAVVGHMVMAQS